MRNSQSFEIKMMRDKLQKQPAVESFCALCHPMCVEHTTFFWMTIQMDPTPHPTPRTYTTRWWWTSKTRSNHTSRDNGCEHKGH